jgi:hypothetical protein
MKLLVTSGISLLVAGSVTFTIVNSSTANESAYTSIHNRLKNGNCHVDKKIRNVLELNPFNVALHISCNRKPTSNFRKIVYSDVVDNYKLWIKTYNEAPPPSLISLMYAALGL